MPGDIFIEILLIFELLYIEEYLYDIDTFSRRTSYIFFICQVYFSININPKYLCNISTAIDLHHYRPKPIHHHFSH